MLSAANTFHKTYAIPQSLMLDSFKQICYFRPKCKRVQVSPYRIYWPRQHRLNKGTDIALFGLLHAY